MYRTLYSDISLLRLRQGTGPQPTVAPVLVLEISTRPLGGAEGTERIKLKTNIPDYEIQVEIPAAVVTAMELSIFT